MRLDVFLWRARFSKTRQAAGDLARTGAIRLERAGSVRRLEKPSASVAPGDLLSLPGPLGVRLIRVIALPDRRGPASEARLSYAEISATENVSAGSAGPSVATPELTFVAAPSMSPDETRER